MASQAPQGVRLVDLSLQMGLERPTAHRLLKTLTLEGMLVQDGKTRRYSLGPLLFELGISATHQFNLKDINTYVRPLQAKEPAHQYIKLSN